MSGSNSLEILIQLIQNETRTSLAFCFVLFNTTANFDLKKQKTKNTYDENTYDESMFPIPHMCWLLSLQLSCLLQYSYSFTSRRAAIPPTHYFLYNPDLHSHSISVNTPPYPVPLILPTATAWQDPNHNSICLHAFSAPSLGC